MSDELETPRGASPWTPPIMSRFTAMTTYTGKEKLMFAIDIGTTHSAIAFAHLVPGKRPVVRMVIKWPGQFEDNGSGDSKVPSLLAYKGGQLVASGAEALEFEGDEEYSIAKWFKLLVHPDSMKVPEQFTSMDRSNDSRLEAPVPLIPDDVPLQKVYGDFFRYLWKHAQNFYFQNPGARNVWKRLENEIIIILTTPNGWDTIQQQFLCQAVIDAGLVSESNAEWRLEFISEGEASVHYSLAYSERRNWLGAGILFAVIDAGGSTVDSTLYRCEQLNPRLVLKEECASECVQTGGIFVDSAARQLLKRKLAGTKFSQDERIDYMIKLFETSIKRTFGSPDVSYTIEFGRVMDHHRALGIYNGKLVLSHDEIVEIFDDVVTKILESCKAILSGRNVENILLVGGFGDSPYLRSRLQQTLLQDGADIPLLNDSSRKAAAEGAAIWYVEQLVASRCARYAIGADVKRIYNKVIHKEKAHMVYLDAKGVSRVSGCFERWLEKNEKVDESTHKTFHYTNYYPSAPKYLPLFTIPIYAWEGADANPLWTRDLNGNLFPQMRPLCTLNADLSGLLNTVQSKNRVDGTSYWAMSFSIEIWYRGSKLQAQLKWEEAGRVKEGRVAILPGESLTY